MPRFNTVLNSFQYGEVSPRFLARTDTDQYQKGVQKLENMIALPQGGAIRRPGTVHVDRSTALSSFHRLIPFIYSKTESYSLWVVGDTVGDLRVFAYKPKGVLDSEPINSTRSPDSTYPQGFISILSFGSTRPFSQSDMDNIQFVQIGDIIFCVTTNHQPFVIYRNAVDNFVAQLYTKYLPVNSTDSLGVLRRPYKDANITTTTITPSAVSGAITLTASSPIFNAGMVGSDVGGYGGTIFKITHGSVTGVAAITSFVSTTVINALVIVNFGSATASDNWSESYWSDYQGWPESIGSFESRLIFGGSTAYPDTVWGSQLGNLFNLMSARLAQDSVTDVSGFNYFGTPIDTDPIVFVPTSREVNKIGWIQSGRTLAIGTSGQEFVAQGTANRVLSASSVSFVDQTTVGSSPVQAIRINKSTVFVSRDKKRLYQYAYDNDSQSYIAENITALADHIADQTRIDEEERLDSDPIASPVASDYISHYGFKYLMWHPSRQVLWSVTTSGDLVGLTWDPQVKCLSWHRHILGGFSNGAKTVRPFVLSAAVVPSESGGIDTLHLLVKRVVNGVESISLEVMGADYGSHRLDYGTQDLEVGEAPVFMDSAIEKVLSPASSVVSGLDHLKGETVDVLADGFFHPQCFVDALTGEIGLNRDAEFVIVGLPYTPKIKFNPIDPQSPLGAAFGMTGRVDRMTIRFYRTIRAIVQGPEEREIIGFRPGSLNMNDPLRLFTGDKRVNVPMGPEARMELEITQDQPFPMTVLGVAFRGQLNE